MNNLREILAAGFGGALATVADIAALVVLVEHAQLSIPLSAFLAATIGAAVGYLWNKHVAFRDRTPIAIGQIVRFSAVAVATAFLMACAMRLVAVDLGVPYLLAKLICAVAVFIAWTYPAQRRLVFRRPAAAATAAASAA